VCYLTQEPELKNPKQFVEVEKLKTIQELVNGIGHELRSPLTVIRNSTRFLDVALPPEIDSPQANKIRRHLSIIQQEIDAANKLINDLLEFVRIQSPEKVKVTLREIIDDALSFAHIPPTVKVIIDFPKLLPFLFVDRHQIKQALLNLIMHSLSSMLSGGKLIIAAKKQECETDNGNLTTDFLVLTVSDTGIGIPTQPLPKIFHPLFLPKTRGIDLGLIVARSLIQANGGKMSDKNIPGIGTVFTLHLPTTKENQISKMKNDDK
jgi:signal transduction histidine kinase